MCVGERGGRVFARNEDWKTFFHSLWPKAIGMGSKCTSFLVGSIDRSYQYISSIAHIGNALNIINDA